MIVDSAIIEARSGRGGDGAVSFRRLKYEPKGGPDGGDGGKGGSIIVRADSGVETLLDFASRRHWFAKNGQPGQGKSRHGADADDLVMRLPPGTLIFNDETGELLYDLTEVGDECVIAPGGKGGLGNEHFKTSTNQTPRQSTPGGDSVELMLRLELKLIADVGLIGLPNAGKSTLLSRISKARPRIADYPFTTLVPQLGIAELSGSRRIIFADIPGLIEHAAEGAGLGHQFLRHVERTRLLVHLLDAVPPDGSDPLENHRVVRQELARYAPELADKTELTVLSKMDLMPDPAQRAELIDRVSQALGQPVLVLSSATGEKVDALLEACWSALSQQADDEESPAQARRNLRWVADPIDSTDSTDSTNLADAETDPT